MKKSEEKATKSANNETKKVVDLMQDLEPFASLPLKSKEAKEQANHYVEVIIRHLVDIMSVDDRILAVVYDILRNLESYDKLQPDKDLEEGIEQAIGLLEKTDDMAYVKLGSLGDLLDENKLFMYPYTRLQFEVREKLMELCKICHAICVASNHYVNTELNSRYLAWGLEPIAGRGNIAFDELLKKIKKEKT